MGHVWFDEDADQRPLAPGSVDQLRHLRFAPTEPVLVPIERQQCEPVEIAETVVADPYDLAGELMVRVPVDRVTRRMRLAAGTSPTGEGGILPGLPPKPDTRPSIRPR